MPLLVFLMFTFPILCHAQARRIGIVNTISPTSPGRDQEVDFILRKKGIVIAIEVKHSSWATVA